MHLLDPHVDRRRGSPESGNRARILLCAATAVALLLLPNRMTITNVRTRKCASRRPYLSLQPSKGRQVRPRRAMCERRCGAQPVRAAGRTRLSLAAAGLRCSRPAPNTRRRRREQKARRRLLRTGAHRNRRRTAAGAACALSKGLESYHTSYRRGASKRPGRSVGGRPPRAPRVASVLSAMRSTPAAVAAARAIRAHAARRRGAGPPGSHRGAGSRAPAPRAREPGSRARRGDDLAWLTPARLDAIEPARSSGAWRTAPAVAGK